MFDPHEGLEPGMSVEAVRVEGLDGDVAAAGAELEACLVADASVSRLDLTGATLVDVEVRELRAIEVVAPGSRWRRVRIAGGRLGTLDLQGADLDEVELVDVRVDYLALGGARVADLVVAGCAIRALDLPNATLERVAFTDSRSDELDTNGLRARDVDLRGLEVGDVSSLDGLRGTTLTTLQVERLATTFARRAGIDVRD
ncbi:uncharacterized protein YjbI with pentapeptide repeats [Pseudoclavibacter chungangensis]|uniref:pentapeptide repeat-containing protein n=1 Tax=Pseudoclavibacter chungangensis TaxID=587635 RepID=UPI0017CFBC11|nr:pentapeptide repeat-containing protein [Pseudoclavibacter chungangensis]NYJ65431.1 uncharacterized protein YjbI with pentapeptide repeats [Pseudoclavibacter chungangensis]